jgi:hypothetical protein
VNTVGNNGADLIAPVDRARDEPTFKAKEVNRGKYK